MLLTELLKLGWHEYATLFPMLERGVKEGGIATPGPLTTLAGDLQAHGCHTPVVLFEGQVLDGRNRIAAAKIAGLTELPTVEYGGDDPLMYVLSLNLHRRQLTTDQLVELGAKVAIIDGRTTPALAGDSKAVGKAEKVAEMLGGVISKDSLERGWVVKERSPELWRDVQRGARSVTGAYREMRGGVKQADKSNAEVIQAKLDRAYDSFMDAIDLVDEVCPHEDHLLEYAVQLAGHLVQYAQDQL